MYTIDKIRDSFRSKLTKGEFIVDKTGVKTIELIGTSFIADSRFIFGLPNEDYIERELCLAQIISTPKQLEDAQKSLKNFRFQIIDTEENSTVFEIIGSSKEIDEALKTLENHGLATVSRTGIAGGFKGKKRLDQI